MAGTADAEGDLLGGIPKAGERNKFSAEGDFSITESSSSQDDSAEGINSLRERLRVRGVDGDRSKPKRVKLE